MNSSTLNSAFSGLGGYSSLCLSMFQGFLTQPLVDHFSTLELKKELSFERKSTKKKKKLKKKNVNS